MRFANELMKDPKVQLKKLGPLTTRSARSAWAEQNEETVRALAPYPISYDVSQVQGMGFGEFTYTELLGGMWVCTQSLEINCRMMEAAAKYESTEAFVLRDIVADKYNLNSNLGKWESARRVVFLPGHNMLDVASVEMLSRMAHEDEELVFKPHPVTNDEAIGYIATRFGWNRIIPKDVSGNAILGNCEDVYVTTASEMAISGTILGKRVHNVSNFFNEGSGAYHSISRILFREHKKGVLHAQNALSSIVSCPWSGVLMPFHPDVANRVQAYYQKSLEFRDMFRPIASPVGTQQKPPPAGLAPAQPQRI